MLMQVWQAALIENYKNIIDCPLLHNIFHLNKPVRIDIRHDIVHVRISIDVAKGNDLQKVINRIQKDVVNNLLVLTEQVPFDVQVKVESII